MGYVFLIPGFVFLGCFLVFPFFKSLVRSFTDWNAFSPDFSFVGLKNYIELFHNDEYWAAIKVNLVFAVVSTLIQTTLGFLLAFAVYYMTPKWQQFYKVALARSVPQMPGKTNSDKIPSSHKKLPDQVR